MSVQEWGIVIGTIMSAALALGPWMFMVHAKLAVLASQVAELGRKIDQAAAAQEKLWSDHARSAIRLETHDVQISQISQRLRDLLE
jgi:predicted signal transduction protein with EAL and GGDEF domain